MKKEAMSKVLNEDNSFGIASVVLGITGILSNFNGLLFGIVALVFALQQKKRQRNSWSKAGFILSIIAIILGIIAIISLVKLYLENPDLFTSQFQLP